MVAIATTWSASVAWRMPRKNPTAMSESNVSTRGVSDVVVTGDARYAAAGGASSHGRRD
jgi:hypothetical protein